ncbi:beta-ketoacyl synthase N-terminal-like domain-containing protein [Saccharopolyspora spinosa]|uniref:beta-ketoacyl synthase N-terminal-like domain-containing protein n=1 Tax=Saccharopolyspora spinosa TaxID=60894 RepID=UPI00376ED119
MTPAIAITRIKLDTGFGRDLEQTWRRVQAGESAVCTTGEFDGAYISRMDSAVDLVSLVAAISENGLPADTGVVMGTNGAPEMAWLTGQPYSVLDDVAEAIGATGPRAVFGTGCIAGTNAICYAIDVLRTGRARAMLVIGLETLTVTTMATFRSWKAIDPAPSRPYQGSSGINLGEGIAVLLLEADPQDGVIAYVNGYGLSSDAFHVTSPPPNGEGLARAMTMALDDAGVCPEDVDYVNGHGTGTSANDTAELAAMRAVFGASAPPISSSKPQLGHTLGAAGVVETAITALAIRDQVLPPTASADPAETGEWDVVPQRARASRVDVAVMNSLAFGGANGVLVLGRHAGNRHSTTDRQVAKGGEVTVPDVGTATELIPRAYANRLDDLGKLAMAAGQSAWHAVGHTADDRPAADRTGLVFATASGPTRTIDELHATELRGELDRINPVTAPNIVCSVTAYYICQLLGIKGPLSAITSGVDSAAIADDYAHGLIRQRRADTVLVVCADEVGGARAYVLKEEPLCVS